MSYPYPKPSSEPLQSTSDASRSQRDFMYDWIVEAMEELDPQGTSLSQIFNVIWSRKKALIMARKNEGESEEKRITSTKNTIANYLSMSPSFETHGRNRWVLSGKTNDSSKVPDRRGSTKRKGPSQSPNEDKAYRPRQPSSSNAASTREGTAESRRSSPRQPYYPSTADSSPVDRPLLTMPMTYSPVQHHLVPGEVPRRPSDSTVYSLPGWNSPLEEKGLELARSSPVSFLSNNNGMTPGEAASTTQPWPQGVYVGPSPITLPTLSSFHLQEPNRPVDYYSPSGSDGTHRHEDVSADYIWWPDASTDGSFPGSSISSPYHETQYEAPRSPYP